MEAQLEPSPPQIEVLSAIKDSTLMAEIRETSAPKPNQYDVAQLRLNITENLAICNKLRFNWNNMKTDYYKIEFGAEMRFAIQAQVESYDIDLDDGYAVVNLKIFKSVRINGGSQ